MTIPGLLRAHLVRISHFTVNVSDLERAKQFWEKVYPLKAVARTNGPSQPYPGLGIEWGQFDGYLLQAPETLVEPGYDRRGMGVHLVEWKSPRTRGEAYRDIANPGWYRSCVVTTDIDAAYAAMAAAGGELYGPPTTNEIGRQRPGHRIFGGRDPDGVTLEWVPGVGGKPPAATDYLLHVNGNVRDLHATHAFMTGVLGLDYCRHVGPTPPTADGGSLGYHKGLYEWEAAMFCAPGDEATWLDMIQWRQPAPSGAPYASPTHAGIVRAAIEYDDLDAVHALLSGARDLEGTSFSEPEIWDLGEAGTRRVMTLTTRDGLAFELVERARYPVELKPHGPLGGSWLG